MSTPQELRARIKQLIIESLHLEGMRPDAIGDEQPLFGDGLGLDSVDALELVVVLEREFGIQIDSARIEPESFASAARLADFVAERLAAE